jgi:hypothetical protein
MPLFDFLFRISLYSFVFCSVIVIGIFYYTIFYLESVYSPTCAYPHGAIAHNYMLIFLFVSG